MLIVLDSFTPTSRNSLLEPLKYLENVGVALWVPEDASEYLNGQYATERYDHDAWSEQEATETSYGTPARCARSSLPWATTWHAVRQPTGSLARLALSTGWFSTACWCLRRRRYRSDAPAGFQRS